MNNAFGMNFFCGDQGKTFLKIESHLVAKTTDGPGARSIMFLCAGLKYMLKQIEVLLHGRKLGESYEPRAMRGGL